MNEYYTSKDHILPQNNQSVQNTGIEADPFGIAPPPEIEPEKDLPGKILKSKDHKIGFLANDRAKAIYVLDLIKETYLGKIEFKTDGPSGIAISEDGKHLFVTRGKFSNDIHVIDSESSS